MSADVESEVSAVLSKDMENIAAKVAAGKTLTSSEREFFMNTKFPLSESRSAPTSASDQESGCLVTVTSLVAAPMWTRPW